MIHARKDYDRIQDPEGKIAEDEPVFLVRAKDIDAPGTMRDWAERHARRVGYMDEMAIMANSHALLTEKWQAEHGCKTADM